MFYGDWIMLGDLSKHYESSGDYAAIGHDSTGGWSYGAYQIASIPGTLAEFINWLQSVNKDAWRQLMQAGGVSGGYNGTSEFRDAWKFLVKNNEEFSQNQHDFIKLTQYDVQVAKIAEAGIDVNGRSAVLRDVVWSTAVQHGKNTSIITRIINKFGSSISDEKLIREIYAARCTKFESSTQDVKASVMRRFDNEMSKALQGLAGVAKKITEEIIPSATVAKSAVTAKSDTHQITAEQKTNRSNYL